jgi:hypothetical protein
MNHLFNFALLNKIFKFNICSLYENTTLYRVSGIKVYKLHLTVVPQIFAI